MWRGAREDPLEFFIIIIIIIIINLLYQEIDMAGTTAGKLVWSLQLPRDGSCTL